MKTFRPRLLHLLPLALGLWLAAAGLSHAQVPAILDNGYRNVFDSRTPPAPGGVTAPTTGEALLPAYQAQRQNGTAFGGFVINGYGTLAPNPVAPPNGTFNPTAVAYPVSTIATNVPVKVQLRSAIIGRPVVVSNISYNFGQVISPPEKLDGSGQPLAGYYREEPLNARLKTTVVVSSGVPALPTVVDATSSDLDGSTVSTVGNTTTTITVGLNPAFYWSKHARKVYATQPGTIVIRWRETASTTVKEETYVIATAPDKPERTLYWTENGFNGPLVEVPAGRVNAVNVIYNSLVAKQVVTPYEPWLPGLVDFTETDPAKQRYKTVYYDNNLIHAYNVEGRVFVEYLGSPRADGTNEPKGYELVNVVKEAVPQTLVVDLGEKVGHLPTTNDAGQPATLEAKILAGQGLGGNPYLHEHVALGQRTLYAIRDTLPGVVVSGQLQQTGNEVLIYWRETGGLDLLWPKQYLGYALQWPEAEAAYSVFARPNASTPASVASVSISAGGSGYTTPPVVAFGGGGGTGAAGIAVIANGAVTQVIVTSGGSGYTTAPSVSFSGGGGTGATATAAISGGQEAAVATAVPLDSTNNPALVYQDDPASAQAVLAPGNLFYTLVNTTDPDNRALIRFTKDDDIWFERVFSKLNSRFITSDQERTVTLDAQGAGTLTEPFGSLRVVDPNHPGTVLRQDVDFKVSGGQLQSVFAGSGDKVDPNFNPGTGEDSSGLSTMVLQRDGKILIGGNFQSWAGHPVGNIARLNADGSFDATFSLAADAPVTKLFVQANGKILVAGGFAYFNDQTRNQIARLNADGTLDTSFNPGCSGHAHTLSFVEQPDGKILVVGNFNELAGQPMKAIGRLNADGTLDTGFNALVGSGDLQAAALQADGKILVSGYVFDYNGVYAGWMVRLNSDGSRDTTYDPQIDWPPSVMATQPDGKILLGDYFGTLFGQPRTGLARLNADGTLDNSFNPVTDSNDITAMTVQPDGKILVVGSFSTVNGQARDGFCRLNADGTLDGSFVPNIFSGLSGSKSPTAFALQADGGLLVGASPSYPVGGNGSTTKATLVRLSQPLLTGGMTVTYSSAVLTDIGKRIEPADVIGADTYGAAAPVYVGYIHQRSGTAFNVQAYKDPFVVGFEEAAQGAIIGVNALSGNDQLEVWWYKKSTPAGSTITGTYWPSFVQQYRLRWPVASDTIVLASNAGSGDLPSLQAVGSIYTQNNPALPGYNPNEEHALMLNGRAWALRDDLNETSSSQPYVLVHYTESDQRPAMRVFKVERGTFTYPAIAGKVLQSPMPMPLLPPPLLPDRSLASYEIPGANPEAAVSSNLGTSDAVFAHYQKFTWNDRKGIPWVRGPHGGNAVLPSQPPTLKMRYFYKTQASFYFPSLAFNQQPEIGTITPYLRTGTPGSYTGDGVYGVTGSGNTAVRGRQPLDITFIPQWPESAPELRMGETLTLPKLGLPSVRGQASAELIYQQSVAQDPTEGMAGRQKSARLFDPTRAKVYALGNPDSTNTALKNALPKIPDSVNTSLYLGKTYFPNLPPHLSGRLYFDPAVGTYGSLVFKGLFMNELVGEKYLQLNVMSASDLAAAKGLTPAGTDTDSIKIKTQWDAAIDGLTTTMETFIENPAKLGTFIVDQGLSETEFEIIEGVKQPKPIGILPPHGPNSIDPDEVAEVFYSDTAVDSYAISASGGGKGFVVLAVGNGKDTDFTPAGQPVSLQVFKVNAPLYRGELKVINSQNPLDEKLTLQHTGDFAGHPEEYDFEWRYAPPVDGLPPKLYSFVRKLISGDSSDWRFIKNPVSNALDPAQDYTRFRSPSADASTYPAAGLPGSIVINDGKGTAANGSTLPNALLRRTFSATTRPLRLFLSMDLGENDGAVVYLNNAPVAAYNVTGRSNTPMSSVPTTAPAFIPLTKVFEIDSNALVASATANNNVFTVELYTSADAESSTTFNLRLEGLQEVENLAGWLPLTTPAAVQGKNRHTIEGTSILTLSDNWIIMRYRAKDPANAAYVTNAGWSKWTEPQLAEGWIKRVLAGINPFQQRVKDLFNHETNTSVSLVEQAGKRWEGDIALNLENINDSGLIEIYETVLRRGKDLSITGTPAINYGGANDALLLAAGYLSDLYMILGNEAYADAANSTIAFNTDGQAAQYGDVATALFSFKGQLATVLDEELSLMRGRDDALLPNTTKAPIYNRLIWNYTRGIDSGEAIYALNYNIKDRTWDYSLNTNNPSNLPADGIISAADAAISYPQGHGDAYGHYLTALTGYYSLLNNPNFTWTPRIEAVLVLGTPVSVDYQDERKFASAAAAVARTASRTLDLTYRKEFTADEDAGWKQLHDETTNANTGRTRNWGTDDWASRGGQGALFHWVTANSLLPATDPNPNHAGIQKIDRTTVPELSEIVAQAQSIQQTLDNADTHLNPLGLAAGGLTFDISPSEVDAGKTHYEQIFERAIGTLQNAVSAFNNAKGSTQFLRRQEDTLDDQRYAIQSQEQAYTNQLIELYGTPYTDDIGPGRTYKQDYAGPDLLHSMYVDLPEIFSNDLSQTTYALLLDPKFKSDNSDVLIPGDSVTYTLSSKGEVVKPNTWTGRRVSPGRMQTLVSNLLLARHNVQSALSDYSGLNDGMDANIAAYKSSVKAHYDALIAANVYDTEQSIMEAAILAYEIADDVQESVFKKAANAALFARDAQPLVNGITANDVTSVGRAAALESSLLARASAEDASSAKENLVKKIQLAQTALGRVYSTNISEIAWANENKQLIAALQDSLQSFIDQQGGLDAALRQLDQAQRDLYALQAEGDRIQQQRLVFRQHSAAIIQGYRTRDFAFRAFRNEALERYNALFDLAARYTYLAARAYDYETGLLDASGNAQAATFYNKIVQARALGVISNGVPQFAGASTGDPGLSGVLAAMAGDWTVAKTRLGFNNPDRYRTTFSLRQENSRIIPGTEGDGAWKDLLSASKLNNILDDPDVRRHAMQAGNQSAYAVPGIVLSFSTTIDAGYNFFGKPLAGGDHGFSPTSFATKIRSSGVAFQGYIGMDDPTSLGGALSGIGATSPTTPNLSFNDPNALSATPYIYLIPAGADTMRSPPLGDSDRLRSWTVQDQAIPLPFNIAGSDYSTQPAWVSAASLSEPPFMLRKHQAFRAVPDGTVFSSSPGFTNSRLIGRSVWNSRWKIVIPGNTLLNDPKKGVQIFLDTVKDIKLHFESYSYSGN